MTLKTASAQAKFIICGEHSILYEGRALSAPIPNCKVTVSTQEGNILKINNRSASEKEQSTLVEILKAFKIDLPVDKLKIETNIPIGAGLGSSAALCVALVRAFKEIKDPIEAAKMAHSGEKLIHGKSSGIDPFTVALETPIIFNAKDLSFQEFSLSKLHDSGLEFVLIDSLIRRNTKDSIECSENSDDKKFWHQQINSLANISSQIEEIFKKNDFDELGPLLNKAHEHLRNIDVTHPKIEQIITETKSMGALGAKLTGAGHGGCVLCLIQTKDAELFTNKYEDQLFRTNFSRTHIVS